MKHGLEREPDFFIFFWIFCVRDTNCQVTIWCKGCPKDCEIMPRPAWAAKIPRGPIFWGWNQEQTGWNNFLSFHPLQRQLAQASPKHKTGTAKLSLAPRRPKLAASSKWWIIIHFNHSNDLVSSCFDRKHRGFRFWGNASRIWIFPEVLVWTEMNWAVWDLRTRLDDPNLCCAILWSCDHLAENRLMLHMRFLHHLALVQKMLISPWIAIYGHQMMANNLIRAGANGREPVCCRAKRMQNKQLLCGLAWAKPPAEHVRITRKSLVLVAK